MGIKPYFETNLGKLYNGDCLVVLKKIESDSVDLVITSPPYNVGIDYDICDDKMDFKDYYKWCKSWLTELYRILKPDGRLCLNHYLSLGNKFGRYTPLMDINYIACNFVGYKHHSLAIWQDSTLSRLTAWGSWLSASAPYINSPYEGILILYKDVWKKQNKGESTILKEDFIQGCSGIWKIGTDRAQRTKATFPVSLPKMCINLFSYTNDLVLDPFMGSGTTAVACEKYNRRWAGIELSENYCAIASDRIFGLRRENLTYGS